MLEDFEKQPVVPSPDGVKSVQLTKKYTFKVMNQRAVLREFTFGDMSANIEIGWSPDSTQFFISYSDAGAIGNYHVRLYRMTQRRLVESKLPRSVARHFKQLGHWCESRGNNLFFLDWTPDSGKVFLVAEVYPTGDCGAEASVFSGYLADPVSGGIVRTFGERQTEMIEKSCRESGKLLIPSDQPKKANSSRE